MPIYGKNLLLNQKTDDLEISYAVFGSILSLTIVLLWKDHIYSVMHL